MCNNIKKIKNYQTFGLIYFTLSSLTSWAFQIVPLSPSLWNLFHKAWNPFHISQQGFFIYLNKTIDGILFCVQINCQYIKWLSRNTCFVVLTARLLLKQKLSVAIIDCAVERERVWSTCLPACSAAEWIERRWG